MDGYNEVRSFFTPLLAYLTLLAFQLILLGLAVAGLDSALRKRERERLCRRRTDP